MDFGANITPVNILKKGTFGGTYLELFTLVLIISGLKSHGKNFMS